MGRTLAKQIFQAVKPNRLAFIDNLMEINRVFGTHSVPLKA